MSITHYIYTFHVDGCTSSRGMVHSQKRQLNPPFIIISDRSAYIFIYVAVSCGYDKCCPKVTPQSAAKTTRIVLDRYMYGPVSQFLLKVQDIFQATHIMKFILPLIKVTETLVPVHTRVLVYHLANRSKCFLHESAGQTHRGAGLILYPRSLMWGGDKYIRDVVEYPVQVLHNIAV